MSGNMVLIVQFLSIKQPQLVDRTFMNGLSLFYSWKMPLNFAKTSF